MSEHSQPTVICATHASGREGRSRNTRQCVCVAAEDRHRLCRYGGNRGGTTRCLTQPYNTFQQFQTGEDLSGRHPRATCNQLVEGRRINLCELIPAEIDIL